MSAVARREAVIRMIGSSTVRGSVRRNRHTSSPAIPGITQSRSTRSGCDAPVPRRSTTTEPSTNRSKSYAAPSDRSAIIASVALSSTIQISGRRLAGDGWGSDTAKNLLGDILEGQADGAEPRLVHAARHAVDDTARRGLRQQGPTGRSDRT